MVGIQQINGHQPASLGNIVDPIDSFNKFSFDCIPLLAPACQVKVWIGGRFLQQIGQVCRGRIGWVALIYFTRAIISGSFRMMSGSIRATGWMLVCLSNSSYCS